MLQIGRIHSTKTFISNLSFTIYLWRTCWGKIGEDEKWRSKDIVIIVNVTTCIHNTFPSNYTTGNVASSFTTSYKCVFVFSLRLLEAVTSRSFCRIFNHSLFLNICSQPRKVIYVVFVVQIYFRWYMHANLTTDVLWKRLSCPWVRNNYL